MFRIRTVADDTTSANAAAIAQVQAIVRERFPRIHPADVERLPAALRNPFEQRFRPVLLVAESVGGAGTERAGARGERVRGFALLLHAPDLDFCYLDFIATESAGSGRGLGSALYERVREEALALHARGLYFECLPDDEALSPDPTVRAENAARLRFYERYGARPIANTAYETPLRPGDTDPPYLVLDPLGRAPLPGRDEVRAITRAILERKYAGTCPPEYVEKVVASINEDPIRLREPRYLRRQSTARVRATRSLATRITLVVNDKHDIHHVHERGYVEAPVRIATILSELEKTDLFDRVEPRHYGEHWIRAVHDGRLVEYLRRACAAVGNGRSVYPYVFPVRNAQRPPRDLPLRAGYYCIDTFTPINGNAWLAARRGVDCALSAAERVVEGQRLAYALVRPPGHHAERAAFGGFCYFNNSAIAANYLSRYGRVAVLDVDYHHGNGTQDIFYERPDVLTVSIHGHPSFAYPYFSGFAGESGVGRGAGLNLNLPLPEDASPELYHQTLAKALARIERFDPRFLVVAAGFDTGAGDPTGSWRNRPPDFVRIGTAIGALGRPTLVVQEGGYRVRMLGVNARRFFEGLAAGAASPVAEARRPAPRHRPTGTGSHAIAFRSAPRAGDADRARRLVASTGNFSPEEEAIAAELFEEGIARGEPAGYLFEIAERADRMVGFAVYGPIPGTERRYDLYWIATHPDLRRRGLGSRLLRRVEAEVRARGGRHLFIDTASTEAYAPARAFYTACGYRKVAELADFYRDGDGKVIFHKRLPPA